MKSKILLFLSLITYTLTEAATTVTVSSVATGSCTNKKYTFVIKANANGDLDAGSATVTLVSPENTTPTCTFAAVSTTASPADDTPADNTPADDTPADNTPADESNDRRRLATGDFDITCTITSKLDNADIKVKTVVIGTITATVAEGGVAMEGKATCEGSSDTTTTDDGKFIQISGFLFLLILTVF